MNQTSAGKKFVSFGEIAVITATSGAGGEVGKRAQYYKGSLCASHHCQAPE